MARFEPDTVTLKVIPEIDEEALRDRLLEVIAGHAVVKPGETLVIRLKDWDVGQVEYYQEYLDGKGLPFRVLAVVGDELAVAAAEADFASRVRGVLAEDAKRAARTAHPGRFVLPDGTQP